MYTVSGLARECGLSRTTILYYESLGLLKPSGRSAGNYRQYGDRELERLREICAYRHVGLSLADIRTVVGRPSNDAASTLQKRLVQIDAEIGRLRGHQRVILRLLGNTSFRRAEMITKDKWVAIMRGCGFTEEQMNRWHAEFERSAPAEHQEFLEFLHIPAEEIGRIREWSRKGTTGK
jgi:MerR family transcriptional regulator, thiopeptide resistance regulator